MYKKTLTYSPQGIAVPDALAVETARAFLSGDQTELNVSNEVMITAVCYLVSHGEFQPADVCIKFNEKEVALNQYGELSAWPDGMADYNSDMLVSIIQEKCRKIKQDRKGAHDDTRVQESGS